MTVAILGAGAFGTAIAIAIARGGTDVILWGRNPVEATDMQAARCNIKRLPDATFPSNLRVTGSISDIDCHVVLLAVPTQTLSGFLQTHCDLLNGKTLVACCKGIDLTSGLGPTGVIGQQCPASTPAIITGPSFAIDIARGLPTALTFGCADRTAKTLQETLSTDMLRLYLTDDLRGAEVGGALKNVIAIASGIAIGAGLGESARAALMTRGYAELVRFSEHLGGHPETLSGLSGFGDLTLTCTSAGSRNYSYGLQIGAGDGLETAKTVEGAATARAVAQIAEDNKIDMPITRAVAGVLTQSITVQEAMSALLSRPLRKE